MDFEQINQLDNKVKINEGSIMKIFTMSVASMAIISSLSAHSLWVNSFESLGGKRSSVTVSLGWGDKLPVSDSLSSLRIEEFSVSSPNNEKTMLNIPQLKDKKPSIQATAFDVYDSDIALQKIILKGQSPKGVYTVSANTHPTIYTKYINTKDEKVSSRKTMDEIDDAKEILKSIKYQAFAKTYFNTGKWTEQQPINTKLEIIPKSDLSNVKVGDLVKFEVLFNGKALKKDTNGMKYIKAFSSTFGQRDKFFLMSYIINGQAQIRVQSKGQRIVSCNHKEKVTKDGKLKDMYKKVNSLSYGATITFQVK